MDRSERGAALVEFALVLPLLLVVIAGIVDFGFVFQKYEVTTNAAREGARLATLPNYDAAAVEQRVRAYVQQGLSMSSAALTSAMGNAGSGSVTVVDSTVPVPVPGGGGGTEDVDTVTVTVQVHHNYLLLGPVLSLINATWGNSVTLTATSQMRKEL